MVFSLSTLNQGNPFVNEWKSYHFVVLFEGEKLCDFYVDENTHWNSKEFFKYLPIRFQWRVRRGWALGWLFWQSQHQLQGCSVLQMIHQWWKVFCLRIEDLIRWIQQGISRNLIQLRRRSWQVHLCQPERTQCQQASQRKQH